MSLGAYSDSFYEYLLKVWLVTNKRDTESRDMFYDAIDVCLGREGGREGVMYVSIYLYFFKGFRSQNV